MKRVKMVVLIGLAALGAVYAGTRPEDMSREEKNKMLVKVALGAISTGDWEALSELYSPKFVQHSPGSREPIYWNQFELGCRMASQLFDDMRYKIEDIIADNDKVVVRLSSSLNFTKNKDTRYETQAKLEMTEIDIFRIEGGRIVEEWCEYDYTSMEGKIKAFMVGRMFR